MIPLFGDLFCCFFSSEIVASSFVVCITLVVTSCILSAVALVSRFSWALLFVKECNQWDVRLHSRAIFNY